MRTSLMSALIVLAGCSHVRAEDQTVAEHRNDAAALQQSAASERAQYEPGETRVKPAANSRIAIDGTTQEFIEYNPSAEHLSKADQYMRERSQHLAAAKKLVTAEDKACVGLSEGERYSCPLLASSVEHVRPSKNGFTLILKPSVDREQTLKRLSCHLAYAVASGFDRPSCPLFVKGTSLRADGTTGVEFSGETAEVAVALRTQAKRIFSGAADLD